MGMTPRSHDLLRAMRRRWGLQAATDVHHVIPRSCARHPLISDLSFDLDRETCNCALRPTGASRTLGLRLRSGRLIHEHGHQKYNTFVWNRLDQIRSEHADDYKRELALVGFIDSLHAELRSSTPTIPWN